MSDMTSVEAADAFTDDEMRYLMETANEYGKTVWEVIHDAVMNAPL